MKIKQIIAAVMSAITLGTATVSVASAATTPFGYEAATPWYQIASSCKSQLQISGTTATCTSSADGATAVKITAEQTLEKYWGLWIWTEVDNAKWSKTVNVNSISMTNKKSGLGSGTYRLKTTFTLTNSAGKTETITVYSDEKVI